MSLATQYSEEARLTQQADLVSLVESADPETNNSIKLNTSTQTNRIVRQLGPRVGFDEARGMVRANLEGKPLLLSGNAALLAQVLRYAGGELPLNVARELAINYYETKSGKSRTTLINRELIINRLIAEIYSYYDALVDEE